MNEVAGDGFYAKGTDAIEVGFDRALSETGVLGEGSGADGRGVDEGVVEDLRTGVVEDLFDVLGGGEAEGLVGLSHEIADVDPGGSAFSECLWDAANEQVRDERGVEGAGAEGDEIGGGDSIDRFRKWTGVGGGEHELDDGAAGGGDICFTVDEGAVVHACGEGGVGGGGRVDATAGGKDLGAGLDRLSEVPGDACESGEEEIAKAVAVEVALRETVLEELGEEVLILREGDEAVAEVAGGEHVQIFAETTGGTSVIGDSDDCGQIADHAGERSAFIRG